jgi:hypothetical protein
MAGTGWEHALERMHGKSPQGDTQLEAPSGILRGFLAFAEPTLGSSRTMENTGIGSPLPAWVTEPRFDPEGGDQGSFVPEVARGFSNPTVFSPVEEAGSWLNNNGDNLDTVFDKRSAKRRRVGCSM